MQQRKWEFGVRGVGRPDKYTAGVCSEGFAVLRSQLPTARFQVPGFSFQVPAITGEGTAGIATAKDDDGEHDR